MGDHVSGPSLIKSSGEPLSKIIAADNSSAGGAAMLPFLFKVLSIAKPLSIQVHPNKVWKLSVLRKNDYDFVWDLINANQYGLNLIFRRKLNNCTQVDPICTKIQTTNRKFRSLSLIFWHCVALEHQRNFIIC